MFDHPEQLFYPQNNIILSFIIFFLSRLYCRLRNLTESALRPAGFTAGRELHPALKSLWIWWSNCILSFYICQVKQKIFYPCHLQRSYRRYFIIHIIRASRDMHHYCGLSRRKIVFYFLCVYPAWCFRTMY